MAERDVEVIPGRLYWNAMHGAPRATGNTHYFSIDSELVYTAFNNDFGPLNLALVYKYCKSLQAKLKDPALADKRIVHYTSQSPQMRSNAAFLIGAYQVIALGKTAEMAFEPFRGIYPPFLPFRDALACACTFKLTVLDCLNGLEEAIKRGWFDWHNFEAEAYLHFAGIENGDMNWIIPNKFLAFAEPSPTAKDADGFPVFQPENFVPVFREADIGLVVRLNRIQYDARRFIDKGIKHVDLYFQDGSCPSQAIIAKFLRITESHPNAVAVHCKAGLGRTGTLIGLYAMKHHQFPARAFIGWNRICRPGSVLGPQQQFLVDMESDMIQAGAAMRAPTRSLSVGTDLDLLQQHVESLRVRDLTPTEKAEDVGQGEMLVGAKRKDKLSSSPSSPLLNTKLAATSPPSSPVLVVSIQDKSLSKTKSLHRDQHGRTKSESQLRHVGALGHSCYVGLAKDKQHGIVFPPLRELDPTLRTLSSKRLDHALRWSQTP